MLELAPPERGYTRTGRSRMSWPGPPLARLSGRSGIDRLVAHLHYSAPPCEAQEHGRFLPRAEARGIRRAQTDGERPMQVIAARERRKLRDVMEEVVALGLRTRRQKPAHATTSRA